MLPRKFSSLAFYFVKFVCFFKSKQPLYDVVWFSATSFFSPNPGPCRTGSKAGPGRRRTRSPCWQLTLSRAILRSPPTGTARWETIRVRSAWNKQAVKSESNTDTKATCLKQLFLFSFQTQKFERMKLNQTSELFFLNQLVLFSYFLTQKFGGDGAALEGHIYSGTQCARNPAVLAQLRQVISDKAVYVFRSAAVNTWKL